jgi:hypothetical protein
MSLGASMKELMILREEFLKEILLCLEICLKEMLKIINRHKVSFSPASRASSART